MTPHPQLAPEHRWCRDCKRLLPMGAFRPRKSGYLSRCREHERIHENASRKRRRTSTQAWYDKHLSQARGSMRRVYSSRRQERAELARELFRLLQNWSRRGVPMRKIAPLIGVSEQTIYGWAASKRIPHAKTSGRCLASLQYHKDALEVLSHTRPFQYRPVTFKVVDELEVKKRAGTG